MTQDQHAEQLLSAGGVVYRANGGDIEVIICGRNSPLLWGLPKGTPEAEETREQTALREVNEETGLEVEIEGFIDSIEYSFFSPFDRVRYHKVVLFYLMSANGATFRCTTKSLIQCVGHPSKRHWTTSPTIMR